jgi:hypothetical protein
MEASKCILACEDTELSKTRHGRMTIIAANLTTIVGSLLNLVGGISILAMMPTCNRQLVDAKTVTIIKSFQFQLLLVTFGDIHDSHVIQNAPLITS